MITCDLKGRKLESVTTRDGKLPILSRKDLIEMKRASGRPQDLKDVKALEHLS